MNKKQVEIIVTPVLIVLLMFILMSSFKKKPRASRVNTVKQDIPLSQASRSNLEIVSSIPPSSGIGNLNSGDNAIAAQRARVNGKWGRDPFQLSSDSTSYSGVDLQLKGVSLGKDGKNFAFINQNVVTAGDTIGEFKVITVEKTRVLLEKEGKSFYLALPQE